MYYANKDLPDEEAIPLDERPPRPSRINTSGHKKSEDASLMKEQIDQLTEEKKTLEAWNLELEEMTEQIGGE